MLVTGLNTSKQMVTISDEPFYTKDRTAKLEVRYEHGYTFRGRRGSVHIEPHVYIRIVMKDGTGANPAWNGFPSLDEAKTALRALSVDGKIYDEDGWDGMVVNGKVELY